MKRTHTDTDTNISYDWEAKFEISMNNKNNVEWNVKRQRKSTNSWNQEAQGRWCLMDEGGDVIVGEENTKGSWRNQGVKAEKATTELCPPNPNEFDMAAPKEKDIHYQIHHRLFKTMTTRAVVTYQRSPHAASSRLRPCQSPRLVLGSTAKKSLLLGSCYG